MLGPVCLSHYWLFYLLVQKKTNNAVFPSASYIFPLKLFGKQLLLPSVIVFDYTIKRGPYGIRIYLQMFFHSSIIHPESLGQLYLRFKTIIHNYLVNKVQNGVGIWQLLIKSEFTVFYSNNPTNINLWYVLK